MLNNINLKDILENGTTLSTSGSTGTPKQIFQPVKKLLAANSVAREVQNIDSKSRILTVCSVKHAGGLLAQTLPAYEVGAHIDIEQFNPFSWIRKITNYTHSHLVPDMARAIIKTKTFQDIDLSGITITCGSDRVQSGIIQSFIDKGATFIVNWGMTEIGPIAINRTYRPSETVITSETLLGNRVWCDYRLENRELWVKGDICVYDDWFATGDIVMQNDDMLYYIGRKK